MKTSIKMSLLGLLAMGLLASCKPEKEENKQKNYTETAFGMKMEMVYVEGGTFEMGATEEQGEDAEDKERPVRTIKLDSYYVGKYEVTQAQWKAVMGTTVEEQKELAKYPDEGLLRSGDNYPMCYVDWTEAMAFCRKLSKQTGKRYVLLTEAQWEYAARGGNKSQHYKYAGSNDINEVAWYEENSFKLGEDHPDYGAHPVGTKKANELGIYDMSGNVWEFCSDWFASSYDYEEVDTENPEGPLSGVGRVMRGGSWNGAANYGRVSFRFGMFPDYAGYDLGFRVAVLP